MPIDELQPVRRRRPAGEPADVDERTVLGAVHVGLHVELERLDVGRLAGPQADVLEAVEEREADAAPAQHLVEGRENDVAHTRLHAPEERAAVGEERAHHAAERLARRDARARGIAVLVGEAEVVEAAQVAGVHRLLRGAVHEQPLAAVVVLDRVEAARVGRQVEADDAAQGRERQVDDRPQAPELDVLRRARVDLLARVGGERVEHPQDEVLGVARQRAEHRLEQRDRLGERGERGHLAVAEEAGHARQDGVRARTVRGCERRRERADEGPEERRHAADIVGHRPAQPAGNRIAGEAGRRWNLGEPWAPPAVGAAVCHADDRRRREGVTPGGDRTGTRVARELGVALAHEAECILVEPHPEVEPVLLDASRRAAPGGPLPTEAPSELIDRDLVAAAVLGAGQLESGRHRGTATADDRHPDGTPVAHSR